jgi:GTPase SAR1 family protein
MLFKTITIIFTNNMAQYKFKIVGNSGVGKTTFINRLANGEFTNKETESNDILWENGVKILAEISQGTNLDNDTDVDGLVLMFDIHNPSSFECLEKYFKLNIPLVLVGNKCDLKYVPETIDEKNTVSSDSNKSDKCYSCDDYEPSIENRWYVKKWRELQNSGTNMKFYEISAKSNYNFDKPFNSLMKCKLSI